MKELELVALAVDLPEHGLKAGDIGTVIHVYRDGEAAEIEFVLADGRTVAVLTLEKADFRPFAGSAILHARPVRG